MGTSLLEHSSQPIDGAVVPHLDNTIGNSGTDRAFVLEEDRRSPAPNMAASRVFTSQISPCYWLWSSEHAFCWNIIFMVVSGL